MKNLKKILLASTLTIILLSHNVNAGVRVEVEKKTKEQAIVELENLAIENEDGSCTWDIKMIDPKIMAETYCNYTDADIRRLNPWVETLEPEEYERVKKDYIGSCRFNTIYSVVENASRKKGNANWEVGVFEADYDTINPEKVTLVSSYDGEEQYNREQVYKTCKLNYVQVDEKEIKDASKVMKKLESRNTIYSLNSFNSIYHYGPIFQNNKLDSEMILYKFPEFKQQLMKNSEYKFEIAWNGGGGTPIETGCEGFVLAYKDDIPLGMSYVFFSIDNRLYVDKDLPGTSVEKAQARLNEYFKGKVNIEFNSEVYDANTEIDGNIGVFTEVKIGEYINPIFIIEVDKKDLDKFEVKAHHKKYNINVLSNSYDVPLDATLNVEDVQSKIDIESDYKIISAYDIEVIKTGNGMKVSTIEDGIYVYLPILNKELGEKVKIFHIKDNNDFGEEYEGEVVELEGNKYAMFKTSHFSTYAIAEDTITNPNTGDAIISSIIIVLLFSGLLLLLLKFKPKKKK